MSFTIRKAKKEDMPQVLLLINQLAQFENEPDAVEVTLKDLENDGFSETPAFICFVAEINNKVEGTAIVFHRFSTWKGKILHLEDLIVNESMRGAGLGTALLDEVIKYGHQLGVKRINWEVLNWNKPAITLYEKKGARVLQDWNVVHLSEQGIKDYIANL
ncbi:ribosomal protein S18 acetylase RimI-like enzyme [Mariniflexile fucanivorans]|uniref:Ribosomal protein S18 acetylase RimI-like enzyme n=1 Tax=Mariniflexile fucanivorans TaxID=264023 RepID=A0A4R1RCF1_9FLAO|nr:GNAT family N-acetyltransferase [Mariniflexile fucanivorans]TCL63514.1 ribosomal protein S18 acetylase RimI-like enzyme [Mariniflexile fucanivorans]